MEPSRFSSLAVVPLVVSDHAVGAWWCSGSRPRSISEADKSFLFTITGAAAQAVERARLTLDRVHQPRAQPAPAPPQLRPGRGDHPRRRGPRGHRRRATGPGGAVGRVPRARARGTGAVVPGQQRGPGPALPRPRPAGAHALGSTFTSGRTIVTTLGGSARPRRRRVPRGRARVDGGVGPAGHHRDRSAHGQRRAARRAHARLRGAPRAERARTPLPLDAGRPDRAGTRAGTALRAGTPGPARRRGGPGAPVPALRCHQAAELQPGPDHRHAAHDEPGGGPAVRCLRGAGSRRERAAATQRARRRGLRIGRRDSA